MDKLKNYLIKEDSITKDAYFWNTVSNFIFAFQSVILLMVLTRVVGLEDSGIFTIAYANASLFLIIGKFGFRNYQVSDVKTSNTFGDYRMARVITASAMALAGVIYSIWMIFANDYSVYKGTVIALMCIYKLPDAIEDLYHGEYQRQGRLDVAAKCMTLRLGVSVISFLACVCITRQMVVSLVISIVLSFISMIYLLAITRGGFSFRGDYEWEAVRGLIIACFPLFAGGFLQQYISNSPKYAIDKLLSDEIQACYGFIFMPVFVIGLLSSVIFNPIIHTMAEHWANNQRQAFLKRFFVQLAIIWGIAVCALLGAWFVGIPVLSIIYNTDLSGYKSELIVLLIGGGFLAVSSFINIILTIIRAQYTLLIGYSIVAIIAFFTSAKAVEYGGVMGASLLYSGLMLVMAVIFTGFFVYHYKKGVVE